MDGKYYSDIKPRDIEKKGYEEWLNKIHHLFQSDRVFSKSYQYHLVTELALQCVINGVELQVMVSPTWGRPGNLYTFLETTKQQTRTK